MTALPRASATTRPVRLSTVAIAGDRLRHLTVVAGTETPLASTYATLNPPGGTVSPTNSESTSGDTRALGVPGAVPSLQAAKAKATVMRRARCMLVEVGGSWSRLSRLLRTLPPQLPPTFTILHNLSCQN